MLGEVAHEKILRPGADAIQARDEETRRPRRPRRPLEQLHDLHVSPRPVGIVASLLFTSLLRLGHHSFSSVLSGLNHCCAISRWLIHGSASLAGRRAAKSMRGRARRSAEAPPGAP